MHRVLAVSKKLLTSDHFLYLGFKSLAAVVNLLSIGLFVSWFGLERYGESALIIASSTLVLSILGQWLINAVSRFFYDHQEAPFKTLWSLSLLLLLLSTVLLFVPAGAGFVRFATTLNLLLLYFSYNFSLEIIRMKRWVIFYGICMLVEAGAAILGGYYLSSHPQNLFNPIYICIALSMYVPLVMMVLVLKPSFRMKELTRERMQEMFRYGYPMSISSLFGQVIFFGARYFLGLFFGLKEVGIFSTLYDISQRGATFILNTLTAASQVGIFKAYSAGKLEQVNKDLNKQINLVLQFSVIVALLYFNAYPYILQLTHATDLQAYKWMLVVVSIIVSINRIKSGTFDLVLQLEKNTLNITRSTVVGAIVSLVPGILLVKFYGIWGAVCSMLFSYLASLLYSYLLVRRMHIPYLKMNRSVVKKNFPVYLMVGLMFAVSVALFSGMQYGTGNLIMLGFVMGMALFSIYINSTGSARGGEERA
ncbi:lipopolysaccharide biosynthesis protein [Deinococcus roseus]|uniref:Polysaccharide biosynthesis protein n=1 Tax=Deinococcus roseus TaxID=392414 RepID=A0ABQ2CVG8_9DEIO|nr:polysaccharide biosynthesis C-terminal domain-containing protein [Deinococcus roseus]GGJ24969.1 hypothetical protein GCM10008938_08840 [Deinococcus roseus]